MDEDIAARFAGRGAEPPDLEKGSFLFILKDRKHGADIDGYSMYPLEREILYMPNHPFKVQSIKRVNEPGDPPQFNVMLTD